MFGFTLGDVARASSHARRGARRTLLGLALTGVLAACAVTPANDPVATGDDAEITSIPRSAVRDQSTTGNCWLYATTAWAESLADGAGGPYSIAYLVYWNFFEQITGAEAGFRGVSWTGGTWGAAAELVARYGMVRKVTGGAAPFASAETTVDADATLALDAMEAINASLKSGALKTKTARRNASIVRAELDRAFGVSSALATNLETVFGEAKPTTFDDGAVASGVILDPTKLRVRLPSDPGIDSTTTTTLREAIGHASDDDPDTRAGAHAYQTVWLDHTVGEEERIPAFRELVQRIQRALHARVPVPVAWCVVDDGRDASGRFRRAVEGMQEAPCAHETLIVDYEATLADGTTLAAGTEANAEEMAAALEDGAEVTFLRVKNSWGQQAGSSLAGHTDIYVDYWTSQVLACDEDAIDAEDCEDWRFMLDRVVLPPGF